MDRNTFPSTRPWKGGLLAALLLLAGCAPLPDDEATWVLEDLARRDGDSRLKDRTPEPLRESVVYTIRGRAYEGDLYRSPQRSLAALVLVPGLATQGSDDPRLVAFARTLARARFLILVPDLANLRALTVRAEDAQGVADAFAHLLARPEFPVGARAGIGAFSYAVGPAVLAALDPAIRGRVDFVMGVGGYYDLHRVITFFTTGYFEIDGQWHHRKPNPYSKWVFVLGNAEHLADPADRAVFRHIAEHELRLIPRADIDQLTESISPAGRPLLDLLENRKPERVAGLIERLPATLRRELDALNIANKDFSGLRARLLLIHGTDDPMIPYSESMDLAAASPGGRFELFLIDGLAHVDIRPFRLDRRAAWRAIGAMLALRDDNGERQP